MVLVIDECVFCMKEGNKYQVKFDFTRNEFYKTRDKLHSGWGTGSGDGMGDGLGSGRGSGHGGLQLNGFGRGKT
jgi:hypothetical protein